MRLILLVFSFGVLLATACNKSVDPEKLYGKWKYIKVENPNSNPPDSIPAYELAVQSPYIIFSRNNDLVILWGGKTLSSGKFRIESNMIRFKENLPKGQTREFPFLVSELNEQRIVFETMTSDGTRVTAVKQ